MDDAVQLADVLARHARNRAANGEFEPYEELAAAVGQAPKLAPFDRLIYQHCKFYLAGQNLVAVDRASMACGLEVRAPFLDRALVELAGRIPFQLKLAGWQTKYILKRALRDLPERYAQVDQQPEDA